MCCIDRLNPPPEADVQQARKGARKLSTGLTRRKGGAQACGHRMDVQMLGAPQSRYSHMDAASLHIAILCGRSLDAARASASGSAISGQ